MCFGHVATKSRLLPRATKSRPTKTTPNGAYTSSVGAQTTIVDGWKLPRHTNSSDWVPPHVDLVTGVSSGHVTDGLAEGGWMRIED